MPHVVLLGDSTLDNGAYTHGGPAVIDQLRGHLPPDWRATLAAVDGSTTRTLAPQLAALPPDATHLVLSVGGNDALRHGHLFAEAAGTVAKALELVGDAVADFECHYRAALAGVLAVGLPTTVCTIYEGNFPDPGFRRFAATAAALFDDAIQRIAREHRLGVIELRQACHAPAHYANTIEPSVAGGDRIARAVVEALR